MGYFITAKMRLWHLKNCLMFSDTRQFVNYKDFRDDFKVAQNIETIEEQVEAICEELGLLMWRNGEWFEFFLKDKSESKGLHG